MNNKCVYVHKLNDEVVYVGSGSPRRVKAKDNRTPEHLMVWENLQFEVISENLSLRDSINLEQDTINVYWGSGKLFNKNKNVYPVIGINFDDLSKVLCYDETSHTFLRWKPDIGKKIKSNDVAGHISKTGYYVVKFKGKRYQAHRIIFVLNTGKDIEDSLVIDHLDGDKCNNNITNLRAISQSANMKNRKHKVSNTGYQCIIENTKQRCFTVSFRFDKRRQIYFNYTSKPIKTTKNHYPTRELALEAALLVRDMLVDSGKIILTNKEEL